MYGIDIIELFNVIISIFYVTLRIFSLQVRPMTDLKNVTACSHAYVNTGVDGIAGNPACENRESMSYVEFRTAPANRAVDRAHCRGGGRAVCVGRTALQFIRPDSNWSKRYDDVCFRIDGCIDRVA